MSDKQIQEALGYPGNIKYLRVSVEAICNDAERYEDMTLEQLIDLDVISIQRDAAGSWYLTLSDPDGTVFAEQYLNN